MSLLVQPTPVSAAPSPLNAAPLAPAAAARSRARWMPGMPMLLVGWIITIFEPQWWVAGYGPRAILKIAMPLYLLLLVIAASRARMRKWATPMLAFVVFMIVTVPLATYNIGYAMINAKRVVFFAVMVFATASICRTPRDAFLLLLLCTIGQFAWWGALGVLPGDVWWHPHLANHDGYGPLMAIGAGASYFIGLGARDGRLRWFALAVSLLCVMGVVSSFARGAVLSLVLVVLHLWVRSPRKGLTTLGLAIAAGVVGIATTVGFQEARGGNSDSPVGFWAEMSTMTEKGGTGSDRKVLWNAAWEVYLKHPVLGAGAKNFGPAATALLRPGSVGGTYDESFGRLYDRTLHSSYFQILSELGTVGSLLFIWVLVDFAVRNHACRRRRLMDAWAWSVGGRLDLRCVSIALESAMVGYLGSAFFYNQLEEPWLVTIVVVNGIVWDIANTAATAGAAPRRIA
jgi:O-antigen ligase